MTLRTGTQKQVRDRYPETMQNNGNARKTNTIGIHVRPPNAQDLQHHEKHRSARQALKNNDTHED